MINFIFVALGTTKKSIVATIIDYYATDKSTLLYWCVGCSVLVVYAREKCDCLNQMVLQVFTGTIDKQFANEVHTTEWCLAQRRRKEILSLLKIFKIAGLLAFLSSH